MFKLYLILVLAYFASAAVYIPAPCPDVKAVENFDMDKYTKERWYEIARYPNDIEKRGNCVSTVTSSNNGRYDFTLTEVVNGKLNTIKYGATPSSNKTGLIFSHAAGEEVDETNHSFPFVILKTDYDNYAIAYKCMYNEETKIRHDYVWIESRTKELEGSAKDAVYDYVKLSGFIDIDKFMWDDFSEEACKVTA